MDRTNNGLKRCGDPINDDCLCAEMFPESYGPAEENMPSQPPEPGTKEDYWEEDYEDDEPICDGPEDDGDALEEMAIKFEGEIDRMMNGEKPKPIELPAPKPEGPRSLTLVLRNGKWEEPTK